MGAQGSLSKEFGSSDSNLSIQHQQQKQQQTKKKSEYLTSLIKK